MSIFPESVAEHPGAAASATTKPLKTFYLDFFTGTIPGTVDGETAMRQAIHKALVTNMALPRIYDGAYGSELETLVGKNHSAAFLQSEIPRMIRDALIYDDRVESVSDVNVSVSGDLVYVEFSVGLTDGAQLAISEVVTA